MRVVVVGGTGRLGAQVVAELQRRGHDATAAAPTTGFDTISGAGVVEGLAGAHVVVDVSNSPSFEDAAVLEFFQTSEWTHSPRPDTSGCLSVREASRPAHPSGQASWPPDRGPVGPRPAVDGSGTIPTRS
jgi:hypothetical protein